MRKVKPSKRQAELLARVAVGFDSESEYHASTLESCIYRGWVNVVNGRVRVLLTAPDPGREATDSAMAAIVERRMFALGMVKRHFMQLDPPERAEFVRWAADEVAAEVEGRL